MCLVCVIQIHPTTEAGREAAVLGLEFPGGIFQLASESENELDQQKTNLLKERRKTKEVHKKE